MDPNIAEALVKVGIELTTLTLKGTTTLVNSKIQSLKEERNADKLRNTYDEIVNELLSEREQAIRIAQAYKEEYEKIYNKKLDIRDKTFSKIIKKHLILFLYKFFITKKIIQYLRNKYRQ